jgi:hypothetical protein
LLPPFLFLSLSVFFFFFFLLPLPLCFTYLLIEAQNHTSSNSLSFDQPSSTNPHNLSRLPLIKKKKKYTHYLLFIYKILLTLYFFLLPIYLYF